jgi:AbrB family looped-hinge helix DNA binding protein
MEIAKVTSKGQLTIPKKIRDRLRVEGGDLVSFFVENDVALIRKVSLDGDDYLQGVAATLSEWQDPEDERAWREL